MSVKVVNEQGGSDIGILGINAVMIGLDFILWKHQRGVSVAIQSRVFKHRSRGAEIHIVEQQISYSSLAAEHKNVSQTTHIQASTQQMGYRNTDPLPSSIALKTIRIGSVIEGNAAFFPVVIAKTYPEIVGRGGTQGQMQVAPCEMRQIKPVRRIQSKAKPGAGRRSPKSQRFSPFI